ncbi:MAG: tricarballylate utilization 4Fe-4S protein TcuB [Burkholderiales bacterium]|nr:tricarballylate utilization 4Fe-4S protein TcuB [Burkholderiales bacterium]
MSTLEGLVRAAQGLAEGRGSAATPRAAAAADEAEVARQLQICNACRYCEGFCAVFPAMTRRLDFPSADVHYLANLCHSCGACLHACQYAPPHEFAVNVPQAMARVRARTYEHYAWPAAFGAAYRHNGPVLAMALAAGLALFLVLVVAMQGTVAALWRHPGAGSFYALFPHNLMVWMFAPVFAFALLAICIGVARFWREVAPGAAPAGQQGAAVAEAVHDALRLKYLDGGHGEGCNNEDDAWTLARRRFHHLTFYGFVLCFAATSVATLYHYGLGWVAPYPWAFSWMGLPKLLGTLGGLGLLAGPVGLAWLHRRRHPLHGDAAQRPMDLGFIALLFMLGGSGLALALWRDSAGLPLLLCAHLGAVMAFFATMPYGKFAHGVYRGAALLKWAVEKRQPSRLTLGAE